MQHTRNDQGTASADVNDDVELELLARAEHVRVIFRHSTIILLSNVSAGSALTAGLWSAVPHRQILTWLFFLILLNFGRWLIARRFSRDLVEVNDVRRKDVLLLGSVSVSGLLWGTAAALFYVPDEPSFSLFLVLILVAITAASTVLLSFHRIAFPVFCAPVVVPLVVQLIADNGASQAVVALVVPIYYGFLFVLSRQIYRYSHEAILNGLLRERHALVDHLTAIPNRRAFEEFLQQEWFRGIRTQQPLTLILSDIDDFKTYNDRYGHAVGDAILRSVASLFHQAARRRTDLAARIGGDEFAIIVPATPRSGVAAIIRNIERNRDRLARGTFKPWSFPTLSFGYCTVIPSDANSAFALFEYADAALYQAKVGGQNGTVGCALP